MRCTTVETAEREKGEAWNRRRIKWARKRGARKELRKLFRLADCAVCSLALIDTRDAEEERKRGIEGAGEGAAEGEGRKADPRQSPNSNTGQDGQLGKSDETHSSVIVRLDPDLDRAHVIGRPILRRRSTGSGTSDGPVESASTLVFT